MKVAIYVLWTLAMVTGWHVGRPEPAQALKRAPTIGGGRVCFICESVLDPDGGKPIQNCPPYDGGVKMCLSDDEGWCIPDGPCPGTGGGGRGGFIGW